MKARNAGPDRVGGWAMLDLASPDVPPMTVLARWVAESYSLFAAKKVPRSASKK